uniref:Uncharacterized protein n=1 Tax=Meloidogyne enterolobii TaxID=390850 RepID=A0A6V7W341_MELEN|nr:unnamed protein product [Meloidogyne enterolobii]
MSLDLLDILFNFDYFVCLLIGFHLNIILIILIIFKTPKEMKTHSRILLQNCVLDILMLTVQLFVEGFHLLDKEVNTYIFPNGILLSFFMKEDFDPFISYIFLMFWEYILNLNMFGLGVQFSYRYLVLNRYICIKMLYLREFAALLERRGQ